MSKMTPLYLLPAEQARNYLLGEGSYTSIDWPKYFNFQPLLNELKDAVNRPPKRQLKHHRLLANKDGRQSWRPMTLLHPVAYVAAVNAMTTEETWAKVRRLFSRFARDSRVVATGVEQVKRGKNGTRGNNMVYSWWKQTEQRSIELALEYDYLIHTDITDCYGSIRQRHLTEVFKQGGKHRKLLDSTERLFQEDGFEGLPQGNVLSDFIAELILGHLDEKLAKRLDFSEEVHVLRFRDDYRIFAKSSAAAEKVLKELNLLLSEHGFRLSAEKTKGSSTIILDGMKPDKAFWIANKRLEEDRVKWLIQIHLVSLKYPQSGVLVSELKDFLDRLPELLERRRSLGKKQVPSMCSILTEIAFDNPRVVPECITIISQLLRSFYKRRSKREEWAKKVVDKLMRTSHNSIHQLWCQRLLVSVKAEASNFIEPACSLREEKTLDVLFDLKGLSSIQKKILRETKVVKNKKSHWGRPISTAELKASKRNVAYDF